MKLLVIEDDQDTADYIARGLREQGHVVDVTAHGCDGLFQAAARAYDLLIVDRMLPGLDGLALVKTLRGAGLTTPVLFLTALSGVDERVEGLEAGGDDYLVKPFAFTELAARVQALGRRPPLQEEPTTLRVADLELDMVKHRVLRQGRRIDLQPREFQLLAYLMRHAGAVVTRTMLLEHVWEFHFDPKTSVVETHISRLRLKINQEGAPDVIHTVRGVGYCLRAPA
jgi:two-component system OmpR family response regulator